MPDYESGGRGFESLRARANRESLATARDSYILTAAVIFRIVTLRADAGGMIRATQNTGNEEHRQCGPHAAGCRKYTHLTFTSAGSLTGHSIDAPKAMQCG